MFNSWDYWDKWQYDDLPEGEESFRNGCIQGAAFVSAILVLVMLCILCGCTTTKYVPIIATHTDTLLITKHQRDSIWLHDSIHVTEKQKGDTIYIVHDRWHTKYIERELRDTLFEHRTDSIPYQVEIIKEVPRQFTFWQRLKMNLGLLFMGAVGCAVIMGLLKLKKLII